MEKRSQHASGTTREFALRFLEQITNNFSEENIIGHGGYGVVYKGVLENGEDIALKKLNHMPGLDDKQFRNEFNNLMRVQHPNITQFVGYCYDLGHRRIKYNGEYIFALVEERILCFEYLPAGSLDKYICDESHGLDWHTRYKIIKGVCEGLNYLHNGSEDPIYHLDLKPANILLDKNMIPKIGDFGLSRLFPSEQTYVTMKIIGTPGYMPPEYIERYEITSKYDVFSLGVIIIRIVAGDDGYSKCADMSSKKFIEHVLENWEKRLNATVASNESIEVQACIGIALRCIDADRLKRPNIAEIVNELNNIDGPVIKELNETDSANNLPIGQVTEYGSKNTFNEQLKSSGTKPVPNKPERVQLLIKNNNRRVPFEENNQKVMLELTGGDSTFDRPGLDLVIVLDLDSYDRRTTDKLKIAVQFVAGKLSPIDRLSVIATSSTLLCPLRQITEASQRELQELVDGMEGYKHTSIDHGLKSGLKVLADRKVSVGRAVGIMLISDSDESAGVIDIGNVPVYTFCLDYETDPTVLNAIAAKSIGGTFSFVRDIDELTMALSQCLAGLLTVVVQDLNLTVSCVKDQSTIQKVIAGDYPQNQDAADPGGSVTVSFGDLYSWEVRKVIVDLSFPTAEDEGSVDIMQVTYSYSLSGKIFDARHATLAVWRTSTGIMAVQEHEKPAQLQTDEACLQTVKMIMEATTMTTWGNGLYAAREQLVEAKNILEDVVGQSNPLVGMLKAELQEHLKILRTSEEHRRYGLHFVLSSETCHNRQRFAAKGNIEVMRLYATPRMDKYLEQARKFVEDPTLPLPSVEDDVKEIARRINIPYEGVSQEEIMRLRLDL